MKPFSALLALSLVLAVAPAQAATAEVRIQGFTFVPSIVTIDVGDSVTWTNDDQAPHTATADQDGFDSGTLNQEESFTFTFTVAGVYEYFCAIHPSMTGAVRAGVPVTEPAAPQSVRAMPGLFPGSIDIFWEPPADDGGAPVTRYVVCRGTAPDALTACGSVTDTASQHGGLQPLTTYYFSVSAINPIGRGPASAPACSKPGPWPATLGC